MVTIWQHQLLNVTHWSYMHVTWNDFIFISFWKRLNHEGRDINNSLRHPLFEKNIEFLLWNDQPIILKIKDNNETKLDAYFPGRLLLAKS